MCRLLIIVFASLFLVQTAAARREGQAEEETKEFALRFPKGSYVMTMFGNTADDFVRPLYRAVYRSEMQVTIRLHPSVTEGATRKWRHDEEVRLVRADGSGGWSQVAYDDSVTAADGTVDIEPVMENMAKQIAAGRIQLHRIAYGKVGKDTRFVLVAVADSPEVFPLLFKLPPEKKYAQFDWKAWVEQG